MTSPKSSMRLFIDSVVIVDSERDRNGLEYLIADKGENTVAHALTQLSGRKPYISNIAKYLGVEIPFNYKHTTYDVADSDERQQHINSAFAALGRKPRKKRSR